ncbi:hypothetical protein AALC17_07200 [Oscillospiraceae bacterium 38-13]
MPNTLRTSQPATDWSSEITVSQAPFRYPAASTPPDVSPAFPFPSGASAASGGVSGALAGSAPSGVSGAPAPSGISGAPAGSVPSGASGAPAVPPTVPAPPAASGTPAVPASPAPRPRHPAHNEFAGSTGDLDLKNHQPAEVIEAPASTGEAFLGSLKAMLLRNRGNFVAATLLIGTQGTTVWEGILHEVGNDYFIIYQTGRQRYILCDIYALKYMEFYDTKQRELCEHLLQENGESGFC